jgi:hypothetical protein
MQVEENTVHAKLICADCRKKKPRASGAKYMGL